MKAKNPAQNSIVRTPKLFFTFGGTEFEGHEGETIAAALMRADVLHLRNGMADAVPRGVFCGMGICQECAVLVDGVRKEACRTVLVAGMMVERG